MPSRLARLMLLLAASAALPVPQGAAARGRPESGEAQLAKMLAGRVAGKPTDCISIIDTRSSTIIDGTAIVYDSGNVLYVNRPNNAAQLRSDDVLVTKSWTSQLCRLDIVELHDRNGLWWRGSVGLEQFVPYARVKKGAAIQPPLPQPTPAAALTPVPSPLPASPLPASPAPAASGKPN